MPSPTAIRGYSCLNCGWADVLAADACPRCKGQIRETTYSGKGTIATFTIIRYPPKAFENKSPYAVALVDLENGPRVIARIRGKQDLRIGQNVSFAGEANGVLEFDIAN